MDSSSAQKKMKSSLEMGLLSMLKHGFLEPGLKASVHVQRPLRSWPNSAEAFFSSPRFLSGPSTPVCLAVTSPLSP